MQAEEPALGDKLAEGPKLGVDGLAEVDFGESYCSASTMLHPTSVSENTLSGGHDWFFCSPSWATDFPLALLLFDRSFAASCDLRIERS